MHICHFEWFLQLQGYNILTISVFCARILKFYLIDEVERITDEEVVNLVQLLINFNEALEPVQEHRLLFPSFFNYCSRNSDFEFCNRLKRIISKELDRIIFEVNSKPIGQYADPLNHSKVPALHLLNASDEERLENFLIHLAAIKFISTKHWDKKLKSKISQKISSKFHTFDDFKRLFKRKISLHKKALLFNSGLKNLEGILMHLKFEFVIEQDSRFEARPDESEQHASITNIKEESSTPKKSPKNKTQDKKHLQKSETSKQHYMWQHKRAGTNISPESEKNELSTINKLSTTEVADVTNNQTQNQNNRKYINNDRNKSKQQEIESPVKIEISDNHPRLPNEPQEGNLKSSSLPHCESGVPKVANEMMEALATGQTDDVEAMKESTKFIEQDRKEKYNKKKDKPKSLDMEKPTTTKTVQKRKNNEHGETDKFWLIEIDINREPFTLTEANWCAVKLHSFFFGQSLFSGELLSELNLRSANSESIDKILEEKLFTGIKSTFQRCIEDTESEASHSLKLKTQISKAIEEIGK